MTPIELATQLRKLSKDYYEGNPQVTDAEFDKLKKLLRKMDPEDTTGFLAEVGANVDSDDKVAHRIAMNSLANVNDEEEFMKWYNTLPPGTPIVVQYKYDGLSLNCEYSNSKMARGLTRGDGEYGEDQSANIKRCGSADQINTVKVKGFNGCVRGEGIIYKDDFEAHFQDESNPRNSAVGAVRKSDSPRVGWVKMACYDVLDDTVEFKTEVEKVEYLTKLGVPAAEYWLCVNADEVIEIYRKAQEERAQLPFAIDGLVLKCLDLSTQETLGIRSDGRPRGQVAFKFPTMQAKTTLRHLELAVGHTGNMTLRGHYDEIVIDGRHFTHTNMDNFDLVASMDVAIGDEIVIELSGDIIPKICRVEKRPKDRVPIVPPATCPSCDSALQKIGVHHRCMNEECEARGIRKIRKWVQSTEIKYYGPSAQDQLYEAGIVTEPAHLYTVPTSEIGKIIGNGNAEKIKTEVDKKRELSLEVFMGSLGVPLLGTHQAAKLIKGGIDTLEKFLTFDPKTANIPGFSASGNLSDIAKGIKKCAKTISNLIDAGVKIKAKEAGEIAQEGARGFCFTGVRMHGEELAKFKKLGWVEKSSVSKELNVLVARNADSDSNKAEKARKYGVQIMGWDEFIKMLDEEHAKATKIKY